MAAMQALMTTMQVTDGAKGERRSGLPSCLATQQPQQQHKSPSSSVGSWGIAACSAVAATGITSRMCRLCGRWDDITPSRGGAGCQYQLLVISQKLPCLSLEWMCGAPASISWAITPSLWERPVPCWQWSQASSCL